MEFMDNKDSSRTIRTGFTDRFVVSHGTWEFTKRCFLMDKSLYKGRFAWFCSYTFCISMRIDQCLELYSIDICYIQRIYFVGIFTQKFFRFLFFFQNREFGEYFCKMPPKNRTKKRSSQEMERMSTQVQAQSPELDELTCVPETQ